MRKLLATLVLFSLATVGRPETFALRGHGRLTLNPGGGWNVAHADLTDLIIRLTPKDPATNAGCELTVSAGVVDEFSTQDLLARKVTEMARQMADEQTPGMAKPAVKPFGCKQGFGFFFSLIDPSLVGKAPEPGNYKQVTVGAIRLNPGVMVHVQLMSDGDKTEGYRQLLAAVEGMELKR